MSSCPVCNALLRPPTHSSQSREIAANCPRCGQFAVTDEALALLSENIRKKPFRWAITSHAIRRLQKTHDGIPRIMQAWLQSVWLQESLPKPQEQGDTFIQHLGGDDVAAGDWLTCDPLATAAIIGTADDPKTVETQRFLYVVEGLKNQGLIEQRKEPTGALANGYRLTFRGWTHLDEIRRRSVDNRLAFMAMQFGDAELEKNVERCFRPAVARTGFELRVLSGPQQRAGSIDDQLRVALHTARFVLADLTHGNNGAYWEAGFAEGLGRPVIYTCRETEWKTRKTHFDTNHLRHVIWNSTDLESAASQLVNMIRATFPADAKMED